MEKICIVAYVFGERYQHYIPLYIYSILKNYPEYHARIYLDKELLDTIKKQLDIIKPMGTFEIIENYDSEITLSHNAKKNFKVKKSIRWLFYDECFSNYDAIYLGDIDILFCREEVGLYEQHIQHCNHLGLPYSNLIREYHFDKKVKSLLSSFKTYGIRETIKACNNPLTVANRLTGLHFVRSKPYYDKILPLIPEFIQKLEKMAFTGRFNNYNLPLFGDEMVLYELVKEAGIGLPPKTSVTAYEYCCHNKYDQVAFRPHHGIHFGIFRNKIPSDYTNEIISSDIYKEYYRKFCLSRENDSLYKKLESYFDNYMIQIIKNMDEYYTSNPVTCNP